MQYYCVLVSKQLDNLVFFALMYQKIEPAMCVDQKHAQIKVLKNAEPWVEDCRSKRAVSDCPASMNGGTGAEVLRVNSTNGKPNRWNFARKREPKMVWCFFVETSDLSTQLARERSVSASSRKSHHAIHTKILTNWRRTSDHRGAVGWERETLSRLNTLEKVETLDFSTDRQGFNRTIFHQSSQKRWTNCQTTLTVTSKREKTRDWGCWCFQSIILYLPTSSTW